MTTDNPELTVVKLGSKIYQDKLRRGRWQKNANML